MGFISDLLNFRRIKYMPFYASRGDYQANGNLYESDIVGSIANAIGSQVGKLNPQIVRQTAGAGLQIKDDYLSRLLALRWAPEYTPYDALYKMASDLVYRSNAFAVIFYTDDFLRVKSIVPVTAHDFKIWEDESGNLLFRFRWDYDGKEYTVPYQSVIHIKARLNKRRFLGTAPDDQIKTTLELLDLTGEGLRNTVKNSANLKGYLKYNNFADEEELKKKVKEFQEAYMNASNSGGIAGLDNTMDFKEISQTAPQIPVIQSQFLRDNIYRYYNTNDKILTSTFTEAEFTSFYESVIEPIAVQLSLEFTFKLLTERERGFGNEIIFTANRLQYATLNTRMTIGGGLFDRGIITINEFRELMYYEPIEEGDVRMVSLNYVKADDQSIYQIGSGAAEGQQEGDAGQQAHIYRLAIPTAKKGGKTQHEEEIP